MAEAPRVKYRPLARGDEHEIRLLHLEPRSFSKGISCYFSYAFLEDNPVYEALSYMWGLEQICGSIVVDGTPCKVRKNLLLALKRLRLRDEERILWVDALCIDQDTPDERNHQVSQMGQIYSQARRVCVWIHPDQPVFRQIPQSIRPAGIDSSSSWLTYEVVHEICHQTYWSRLWIIQELVLAADIQLYFGNLTVSWAAFSASLRGLGYNTKSHDLMTAHLNTYDTTPAKLLRLSDTNVDQISQPSEHTLIHLMTIYHSARCANPRDKAYALLSLAAPCCQNAVPVDYDKSVYDLWNVLLAHHLSVHCTYATTIDNIPTAIRGANGYVDSQRIKQAIAIRNLLSARTPPKQCHQLTAKLTRLFSVSNELQVNFTECETISMIGTISSPIYHVSPPLGNTGRPLAWLGSKSALEVFHSASKIKEHLDQGLSSHNARNYVTAPGQRPHSIANFSNEIDLIQEIPSVHQTPNSRFVDTSGRMNGHAPVQGLYVSRALDASEPVASYEYDSLVELLNILESMIANSCLPNPCVLAVEESGKAVLAPPNTKLGDFICKLESSSIYLILRPNGVSTPLFGAGIDSRRINRDALFNSNLYTIVGRAISLFSSDPGWNFPLYDVPLINIYVDAPVLQTLTRLSAVSEPAAFVDQDAGDVQENDNGTWGRAALPIYDMEVDIELGGCWS